MNENKYSENEVTLVFLTSLVNKIRVKRYKKKKVKESKSPFDIDYNIKFKIILNDNSGNHVFDSTYFDIVIPAKGAFFARKKLENHIKENINIEIIDIVNEEN